jgi:CDP-diacylglycerol--glycerol-3-phosphate 3-phosphatidyltransferase
MIESLKPFYNSILKPIALFLNRIGFTPNLLTIAGVVFFAIGAWLTAVGYWRIALIFFIIGSCIDGLDGVLARETDRKTAFGAILDSVCDRITEILWFGSIILYFTVQPIIDKTGICMGFAALTGSLMVSYIKARAEAEGIQCSVGLLQRPERLILLSILQLTGSVKIMTWGLGFIAVAAYLTALQRIYSVMKKRL